MVLASFSLTDQSAMRRRPAVVGSSAGYDRHRPDLVILAITSQVRPVSGVGEALIAKWRETGLLRPSVLNSVLDTIERGLVLGTLGSLAKKTVTSYAAYSPGGRRR